MSGNFIHHLGCNLRPVHINFSVSEGEMDMTKISQLVDRLYVLKIDRSDITRQRLKRQI